ncbi:MAG: alcohol dehydrogenase catalytic domain-containing protein [Lachnospiraceae bacterium]|nr:alcohol dehydrogenase catalytic domain-containing protein [Lachnospiraceae bacterium]
MKAILKTGEGVGFSYEEIEKPSPKANEVLIDVKAAAICGTDIHYYHWNQAAKNFVANFNVGFPFIVGHECGGVIAEVGSDVKNFKVGDKVSLETHIYCGKCYQCQNDMANNCQHMEIYGASYPGCFADYALAPENILFKLPDSVSFEEGALFEPAGVAMHAIEKAELMPGDTVLVMGCGAVGLFAVKILLACGASRVIAADIDTYRLDMAKKFGAIAVNTAKEDLGRIVSELTEKRGGVDVILEMTGSPKVYEKLFSYLRPEGRVVTVGHPGENVSINITQSINLKGARIKGVFGRRIWETWWKLSSLVESGKVNLLDVVTHRFAFSDYEKAFEQIPKGAGKILFIKETK